jgi:hypothetical protein
LVAVAYLGKGRYKLAAEQLLCVPFLEENSATEVGTVYTHK